jgi:hypothetical protein
MAKSSRAESAVYSRLTDPVSQLWDRYFRHVQNRESKAVHLKLDELIYAAKNARNELISIEHLTEEQLDNLSRRYAKLAGHYQNALLQLDGSPLSRPRDRPSLILRFPMQGIGGQHTGLHELQRSLPKVCVAKIIAAKSAIPEQLG